MTTTIHAHWLSGDDRGAADVVPSFTEPDGTKREQRLGQSR